MWACELVIALVNIRSKLDPNADILNFRGGLTLGELLKWVPIADALARAHATSIVHRDLKLGNIIVGEDGQVIKLLDLGLAKLSTLHDASDAELTRPEGP